MRCRRGSFTKPRCSGRAPSLWTQAPARNDPWGPLRPKGRHQTSENVDETHDRDRYVVSGPTSRSRTCPTRTGTASGPRPRRLRTSTGGPSPTVPPHTTRGPVGSRPSEGTTSPVRQLSGLVVPLPSPSVLTLYPPSSRVQRAEMRTTNSYDVRTGGRVGQ